MITPCQDDGQAARAFFDAFAACPIIAILRPLPPQSACAVASALIEAGIKLIEVPLNGAGALESLKILSENFSDRLVIGTGTALSADDVKAVHALGVRFVLSPHVDRDVIKTTRCLGMVSVPGVATSTEAFRALKYGASALKLFPGGWFTPPIIKSLRSVLAPAISLIVSGGVDHTNCAAFLAAGANGFGVAGAIYNAQLSPDEIREKALNLVKALPLKGASA